MQQCNVRLTAKRSNYKMEHLLCRLHLITSRSFCPVERFIGTLERQVTALAGLKLRHAHGHRDRYRLTLEVERARGNGLTQYFTYGQRIRQG